jgi:hypothetical protein
MRSSRLGEEAIPKGYYRATLRLTNQLFEERGAHVAGLSEYVIVDLALPSAKTQDVANVACKSF